MAPKTGVKLKKIISEDFQNTSYIYNNTYSCFTSTVHNPLLKSPKCVIYSLAGTPTWTLGVLAVLLLTKNDIEYFCNICSITANNVACWENLY